MQKAQRLGRRVRALDERPELYPDLDLAWACFLDLHRERGVGFASANPISVSSFVAWADLHSVEGGDFRTDLYRLIVAADVEILRRLSRHADQNEGEDNGDTRNGNRG